MITEEFKRFEAEKSGWDREYMRLNQKSAEIYAQRSLETARHPENRSRNRYTNVLAFDETRVKLSGVDNDYINANLLKVPEASREYILSQGPLNCTAGHFWLMVFQQKCKGILMLNKLIEKQKVKCVSYFPTGSGSDKLVFDDVDITVTLDSVEISDIYLRQDLIVKLKTTDEVLKVPHYQFLKWPDFDVPKSTTNFLSFLQQVRQDGMLESSSTRGPPVIHCSAGIGRSGSFCVVDSVVKMIEDKNSAQGVDVRNIILDMRSYRWGLIQTSSQLRFVYKAIIKASKLTVNSGHGDSNSSFGCETTVNNVNTLNSECAIAAGGDSSSSSSSSDADQNDESWYLDDDTSDASSALSDESQDSCDPLKTSTNSNGSRKRSSPQTTCPLDLEAGKRLKTDNT